MEQIEITTDGTVSVRIDGEYTADQLQQLLAKIGEARSQVAHDPENPVGLQLIASAAPAYYTEGCDLQGAPCCNLSFRHTLFGWTSFILPISAGAHLAGLLSHQVCNALRAREVTIPPVSIAPSSGSVQ